MDWLQAAHGMDFETALEEMARRTGITLPSREQKPLNPAEDRALRALAAAQDFYETTLHESYEARAYLEERGITQAIAEEEGIGFAPGGWDTTITHLQAVGFSPEILEAAGLAVRSQRGTLIDFLRERITIPIKDTRGRVIAFGGRAMPDAPADSPKYMNTRETALFKKSEVVFHLHRAKAFMRDSGAVLVEGYFDTIALCQQGVQGAVAPLGTALTEGHLNALKRWTNRLTIAMDGDEAGQRAAHKALTLALPMGFDVRLLVLPEGDDPDTWARALGEKAKGAVAAAPDWATFALDKAKAGKDLRRLEDRMRAAREVAQWIAYLPRHRRDEVVLAAAHELKVPAASFTTGQKAPQQAQHQAKPQTRPMTPPDDAVGALAAMAARGGPFVTWVRAIPAGWWNWRDGAGILEALLEADGDASGMTPDAQAIIRGACAKEQATGQVDPKRLQLRLEREFIQREQREIFHRLGEVAGDQALLAGLQSSLVELRARMARITRGGWR
jgi:DNA primase